MGDHQDEAEFLALEPLWTHGIDILIPPKVEKAITPDNTPAKTGDKLTDELINQALEKRW